MYISELYRRTDVGPCYLLNYTYMGEQSHNLYKTKEIAEREKRWLGGDIVEVAFLSNKQQVRLIKLLASVPLKRSLQPESLLPSRGVAGSGLRPLPNIPHCCLP